MVADFKTSKSGPIVACTIAYGAAFGIAWLVWQAAPSTNVLWTTFWADVAATVVIFISGLLVRNSSMYDPYWSVAPIVIAGVWLANPVIEDVNLTRAALVVLLVAAWGLRLTYNCFRRWSDLTHIDFRYVDIKAKSGKLYPLADLLGIEMMPTILVFLACLPVYPVVALSNAPLGFLDLLALVVTVGAIVIETQADQQLVRFQQSNPPEGAVCKTGLWGRSRHPNYFGEMAFWWGLALFGFAAAPGEWIYGLGALLITLLFVFISVPMMQTRKKLRRPDYEEQVKGIRVLVPLP